MITKVITVDNQNCNC